ncbi:MAG: NirD/YgiW/YdeI family stress tolerance protein [Lactobacillaceae bacterium]|jgi:uncharacterized protein (TIGR00156 family)|nr:NirD/YgiW/YdeI family stress tolerance protein [Lactobacillaceae bacterium]
MKKIIYFLFLVSVSFPAFAQTSLDVTASQIEYLESGENIILTGDVIQHIKGDEYLFADQTGRVIIKVNEALWKGRTIHDNDVLRLYGTIEKDSFDGSIIVYIHLILNGEDEKIPVSRPTGIF